MKKIKKVREIAPRIKEVKGKTMGKKISHLENAVKPQKMDEALVVSNGPSSDVNAPTVLRGIDKRQQPTPRLIRVATQSREENDEEEPRLYEPRGSAVQETSASNTHIYETSFSDSSDSTRQKYTSTIETQQAISSLDDKQRGLLRPSQNLLDPNAVAIRRQQIEESETKYYEVEKKESGEGQRRRRYPWDA